MMYKRMKEIPVRVVLNENGSPEMIEAEAEQGEYRKIAVESSCFYEALKSSYQSNFRVCTQIYAYRYKIRICLDNQVRTYFLDYLLEDSSWVLRVNRQEDPGQWEPLYTIAQ